MQKKVLQILARLADHEARLKQLEGESPIAALGSNITGKQKTLREIVKGKKFKSGQEQIAAIVGYHEKVLGQLIQKDKIRDEWVNAKMNGRYATMFFSRAKDTLIRVHPDGSCDLTQSGEEFFTRLLNSELPGATSK